MLISNDFSLIEVAEAIISTYRLSRIIKLPHYQDDIVIFVLCIPIIRP